MSVYILHVHVHVRTQSLTQIDVHAIVRAHVNNVSMFFEHPLMPTKAKPRHETHSEIIENHIPKSSDFYMKLKH